jgi:thiamine pyrophosphokinase
MGKQQRAILISASTVTEAEKRYYSPGDFVVACDAGYQNAEKLGIRPDLILGDFDSAPQPRNAQNQIVLPHIKDDTDTHFAARWLLEHGYRNLVMLGALGGARMEHTFANVATGLFLAEHGAQVLLADARSELRYLLPGCPLTLSRRDNDGEWKYLSLFPIKGIMRGVEESGVFYPLHDAVLTPDYPLGVSNEFVEEHARLSCGEGAGLVVLTRADGAHEETLPHSMG